MRQSLPPSFLSTPPPFLPPSLTSLVVEDEHDGAWAVVCVEQGDLHALGREWGGWREGGREGGSKRGKEEARVNTRTGRREGGREGRREEGGIWRDRPTN